MLYCAYFIEEIKRRFLSSPIVALKSENKGNVISMKYFKLTQKPCWAYLLADLKFFLVDVQSPDFSFLSVLRKTVSPRTLPHPLEKEKLTELINKESAALARLREKKFSLNLITMLNSLSLHHISNDDLSKADATNNEAKQICIDLIQSSKSVNEAKSSLAQVLYISAVLHQERNDYGSAITACKSALEAMVEVTGNNHHSAHWPFHAHLCLAFLSAGFYDEAAKIYADVYDCIHQKIQIPPCFHHKQSIWQEKNINLGIISSFYKSYTESAQWFEKARSEVESLPNSFSVMLVLYNTSISYYYQGLNREALETMQEAKSLFCKLMNAQQHPLLLSMNEFIEHRFSQDLHCNNTG